MGVKTTFTKEHAVECISELWCLLSADEREKMLERMTIHTYRKNEEIYFEGQEAHSLMCLISGRVKIYRNGKTGRKQIMRVITPVQFFGFRAFFAGEPYKTGATAIERSELCMMPMDVVMECVKENNALALLFIRLLSSELGMTEVRAITLTQKHVRARIAETLLFLREHYGLEADGATLSIYLPREDLANMSNMTTSNAIRTLSSLAEDKVIAIDGRKIKIMDEANLVRIARTG